VPNDKDRSREYYVWWEKGLGETLVESGPYLRAITAVKEYTTVVIGEDGQLVKTGALACRRP